MVTQLLIFGVVFQQRKWAVKVIVTSVSPPRDPTAARSPFASLGFRVRFAKHTWLNDDNGRRRKSSLILLHHFAFQFLKRAFFKAADVGARDAELYCDLTFSERLFAVKAVAHDNDLSFAFVENGIDEAHGFF